METAVIGKQDPALFWKGGGVLGGVQSQDGVTFLQELDTKLSWPAQGPVPVHVGVEFCILPPRAWASPCIWLSWPMKMTDSMDLNEMYTRCVEHT